MSENVCFGAGFRIHSIFVHNEFQEPKLKHFIHPDWGSSHKKQIDESRR